MAQNYPHISIKELNVTSANLRILKNVSIDIPDRSITAIIGPSGCGKTTLLKCMNRLVELIDDIDVEIIADGVHLPAPLLKMVYKIKGPDRIALITDAMRAAGMP